MAKEITFYMRAFPPVSLTGGECNLSCSHCNRKYLQHMLPAETPEKLFEACRYIADKGIKGVVLSGGSEPDGTVPLYKFADTIRRIKDELGLKINAHTGPLNREQSRIVVESGVDAALVDVIGSAETIKKVYGLDFTPEDIGNTIKYLREFGIPNISPHLIVGLDYCKIKGERNAIRILENSDVDNVVVVIIIPTKGTEFEGLNPPPVEDVSSLIKELCERMPSTNISLSCVRPGGSYRDKLDRAAVLAGVNKMAIPSKAALDTAKELGLKIKIHKENRCCSWP
ncbi:MAG: radical SAM protein [Candidatus Altiarchaeota archaeon]|nr:radical SAM protein [Candidatus Altiarchaeota archaeon]